MGPSQSRHLHSPPCDPHISHPLGGLPLPGEHLTLPRAVCRARTRARQVNQKSRTGSCQGCVSAGGPQGQAFLKSRYQSPHSPQPHPALHAGKGWSLWSGQPRAVSAAVEEAEGES